MPHTSRWHPCNFWRNYEDGAARSEADANHTVVHHHRMVPVVAAGSAIDAVNLVVPTRIVSITSNEPVDGDTGPDWEITGPASVNLRAERSGTGSGRIYTITLEARDRSGNVSTKTVTVIVPKHR
jgi:hypothetical protein